MKSLILLLIRGYQRLISPLLPSACRFWPSCSTYAIQAVERHGVAVGGWLALRRLARCHPFHPGGIDPVPEQASRRSLKSMRLESLRMSGLREPQDERAKMDAERCSDASHLPTSEGMLARSPIRPPAARKPLHTRPSSS